MKIEITGIKCNDCDYEDLSVPFENYRKFINKPCPNCGKSLLTIKEYNNCIRIINIVKIVNLFKFINPLFYFRLFKSKNKEYTLTIKE